jgi:Holliday junction DNA helicase RuvA
MYDYIKGTLAAKSVSGATVEAGGVGYFLQVPLSTYEKLPDTGAQVTLYAHHHVREDAQKLFGFLTQQERGLFRILLNVNMVGPKVALALLSGLSVGQFVSDIRASNISRIKTVPGIGLKTAERLVVELRGKLGALETHEAGGGGEAGRTGAVSGVRNEAFTAMVSLGYNEKQVEKAFLRVETVIGGNAPAEEWIKKALQVI